MSENREKMLNNLHIDEKNKYEPINFQVYDKKQIEYKLTLNDKLKEEDFEVISILDKDKTKESWEKKKKQKKNIKESLIYECLECSKIWKPTNNTKWQYLEFKSWFGNYFIKNKLCPICKRIEMVKKLFLNLYKIESGENVEENG